MTENAIAVRTTVRRALWGAAAAAAASWTAAGSAQVASALLVEDGPLPGGPAGHTVEFLNNTAVNHVGGYAVTVSSTDGMTDLSHVWGSPIAGAGTVLRTEGTFGDLEQSSFESFYGISNAGQVAYSATCTDTSTMTTGLDSVWLDDTVVAIEEAAVASLAGQFWSFASRPGVTADGVPYWVGGITDTSGGGTQNRGLFLGDGATVLLIGGDAVPGLPALLSDANTVSFDYRFSAFATAYMAEAQMTGVSSTADNVVVQSGSGLMLGGGLVREGDPVPGAIGGLVGENWDNFDFTGITENGDWFFSGDTDGDTATDEIVVVNGSIAHREGDVLDGETLSGSIEGAYMNENGDLCFIWDIQDNALEALYFNGSLLLADGDSVDLDGDGVVEPGSVISSFTGISTLTMTDRNDQGDVCIYFTADVDTAGTASTLDDTEGFFELTVAAGTRLPEIPLDVGPRSCRNPIGSLDSGGLPVRLLGTPDFDVTTVDLSSLRIGRADGVGGLVAPNGTPATFGDTGTPEPASGPCGCPSSASDGFVDLGVEFDVATVFATLQLGSVAPGTPVVLEVSGILLNGGDPIVGRDCSVIKPAAASSLTGSSSAGL